MNTPIFIVYCSPGGSTRLVARTIDRTMTSAGLKTHLFDLHGMEQAASIMEHLSGGSVNHCLLIGSPVYRDVAAPPVMQFINTLPQARHGYAVPFVTWGGACSGIALWQMGKALLKKGYTLAGAAKILAQHSMMWDAKTPEGAGHPDEEDINATKRLCTRLVEQLRGSGVRPLELSLLDYQPETEARHMKEKLDQPWLIIPKTVDDKRCTRCGVCQEECPAAAISIDDLPRFHDTCFNCFNCVRLCPEEAIVSAVALADIHQQIRDRVNRYEEARKPVIF